MEKPLLFILHRSYTNRRGGFLTTSLSRDAQAVSVPREDRRGSMAEFVVDLGLDREQIRKAVLALLVHHKTRQKTTEKQLLSEEQNVFLSVTVWKIPKQEQIIKIVLPHGILKETSEVCLFTKDEPGLTAEQTENLYKKLLSQHGITNIAEVISYKTLKNEYKPYEAKRRLLNRFTLFLSDDRIRRLLPSHIGKHFYASKKVPQSVNLKAKNLAKEINKHIQGTKLPISNKGCYYSARIGHTGMKVGDILENVVAAARAVATKAPKIWNSVKILHLKMDRSVALPIFTRCDSNSDVIQKQPSTEVKQKTRTNAKKKAKKRKRKTTPKEHPSDEAREAVEVSDVSAAGTETKETAEISSVAELEEADETIPQLVPIETLAEPSPAARVSVKRETAALRAKRKKTSLSPEVPVMKPELPEDGSSLQTPKLLKQGKKPKTPKARAPEKETTKSPQTPEAKSSSVTAKMEKTIKSAKKAPKTPTRELRKRKAPPQSV
ncbi:ribosomal L1 domain-containing protein 1 [Hemicordylus capensis]|uniref:ribosomal L1 domain-containing protein 1 n=1 Tax=Hemicordylus capensis TaxID=884348 RepID=UPI002303CF31|nr:ribosomal L1 domain-containing protein 1 [Hemicordylus capensis]